MGRCTGKEKTGTYTSGDINMAHVYMLVTKDKYELPLVVADTIRELADKCGVEPITIRSFISHQKSKGRPSKYIRVDFDDED